MSKLWKKLPWIMAGLILLISLIKPALLPWLLLAASIIVCLFMPRRGLIGPVELPADDAFLPTEQVQWWYWTGHLFSGDGRRFGFEVVFFSFDSFVIMRDQLVQAAITDVDGKRFAFEEFVEFHLPQRGKNGFKLSSGKDNRVTAVGGDGHDRLHAEVGDYVLDIELIASQPPALHYGGDAHPYRFGGYTYYYSRPKMTTRGTLTIAGETFELSGNSWFDRQYGELYQAIQQGWQWFAIELDDNRQIMLFDFKGNDSEVEKSGSITDANGLTTTLAAHEFQVTVLDQWISPSTGCSYPSGWEIEVRGEKFSVQPLLKDQELHAQHKLWIGPVYWEGACGVSGTVNGQAYVELNGYCRCPAKNGIL
ncbi:carotenoid 1,2-hydratase [Methylomonas sp. SURF-2]|uniref:Carotenoid 1,2-hydratase n=1 Tax=Methylomonas subterranea TaxID=2952225 RepID=A0ABT1TKY4_9GAMM|nr:lipocalin family protein [Methylomonas sp. SURF-2]MCQ8105871.1 carotenoid 1,2-hydratase [Methylomonas sp. SURF-2]